MAGTATDNDPGEDPKMISVIVPIFNTQDYLECCIKSILTQSFKNFELLLINDGSTDKSGEICEKYASMDERIRYIYKENGGLSDARNKGIECAKGEYLAFIDSDDFIHKDMLKILYDNLLNYNADISVCSFWWLEEAEAGAKDIEENEPICFEQNEVMQQLFDRNLETVVAWNKLYRAEMFQDVRYPVGRLHEDEFIVHRLLFNCSKIVYSNCKLYYYIRHSNSITGNVSEKRIHDTLDAFADRISFLEQVGLQRESDREFLHWMMLVRNRYEQCEKDQFPGHENVQVWLRKELRRYLPELKGKKVITRTEWLMQLLWTYNPTCGIIVRSANAKMHQVVHGCKAIGKSVLQKIGEK